MFKEKVIPIIFIVILVFGVVRINDLYFKEKSSVSNVVYRDEKTNNRIVLKKEVEYKVDEEGKMKEDKSSVASKIMKNVGSIVSGIMFGE